VTISITKDDVQRICDEIERDPPPVLFATEASDEEIADEVGRALLYKLFTRHFNVASPDTEPEPDEYETPSQAKFNKFVAFVASYSQGIWHSSEYVARLMDALRRQREGGARPAGGVEVEPASASKPAPRDFLTTGDWTRDDLERLLEAAARFKRGEDVSRPLAGKSIALVFFNPSLRTRASMQVGIYELGGNAVVLEPGGTSWTLEHRDGVVMDGDKTEHVAEFVRVLGRYCAAIGVRTFAALKDWKEERRDPILAAFARHSDVPVINLESAMHHPCQALADMLTIKEKLGAGSKRVLLTWAWHPKPLPMAVPNSFALAAAQLGHELTIAHPPGYELDDELIGQLNERAFDAGTSVRVTNDVDAAFDGAEVVYAKSWGSKMFYGAPEDDIETRAEYHDRWIVDEAKMRRTAAGGIFMHCLPVRRNVIVTDGVIDSAVSVVIDEAENRLHAQKAIMQKLSVVSGQ
jgi:N-acetylornithine carbamoyltransferase